MLFHSLLFIYLFLPVTIFLYYISWKGLRNIVLLAASLIFSSWFQIYLTLVLVGSITINYFAGIAIERCAGESRRKILFAGTVALNLILLVVFKYLSFLGSMASDIAALFGADPFIIKGFLMPLGISFYTFKALSYIISVKRKEIPAERKYIVLATYIAIFPQLAAGPIDRYRDLAPQLPGSSQTFERFASGIKRFVLGLGKKVIIATPLALVADHVFNTPVPGLNALAAWLGAICYMLYIYYDFSGYTDMAIGIGRMFGLEFKENFNFPYIARSVSDFWKRWHITLSTWLRDYLFLPLAYTRSKKMTKDKYFHLKSEHWIYMYATIITFLLCGLWHGAAWTFLVWGLLHGIMLVAEQLGLRKFMKRRHAVLQHVYLLLFLIISWVLFRSPTVRDAISFLSAMAGAGGHPEDFALAMSFIDTRTTYVLILALLGATRFFDKFLILFRSVTESRITVFKIAGTNIYYVSEILFVILTLAMTTIFIISGTISSFIYFKF